MDRRRVVIVAAAVALVGGVVILRTVGAGDDLKQPKKPPPTALTAYAVDGVLIPSTKDRPHSPANPVTSPGHHRLKVRWDGDAPGYEVRWGGNVRFVTRQAIQLDGLENEKEQQLEIRAVDAFGQRSEPVTAKGTPRADNAQYAFVDRFDGPNSPDPTRWRFAKRTDCARATPGDGDDHQRLVVSSNCATNVVSLRSRAPFVRAEESRFVVETDAPNSGGQLLLDLVPGPVSIQPDEVLPQAVRLAVTTDASGNSLVELFPNGTSKSLPQAPPGLSSRWELVITPSGIRAERDGQVVATSPFVPPWQEATALVGVAALAGDRTRAGIDLVGFRGGATKPPELGPTPDLNVDVNIPRPAPEPKLPGVSGGHLRLVIVPAEAMDPNMKVLFGGAEVTLRPALPGIEWQAGIEYPAIADLPPEAITEPIRASLTSATRVQVTHADVELTPTPGSSHPPPSTPTEPLSGQHTRLAQPRAELLDATAQPVPQGEGLARGRLVLEVRMDSLASAVSGLAGFDVRMDDTRIATVATAADGPGVGGRWRISLNTSTLSTSPHTIEIRAFSTDSETPTESAHVSFVLKP
ncbi:hypothetical protein FKR81_15165 [Lentzea tibetensis]|uniref:Uncharacterized protein n=1 Tax=Lentzea tibetensis TaxID=2591470 RepID=A0A563EV17_9PSEU|nr:hypothetical protein [Lentzea tibetensis]TWP51535.1 hypothetical protein FKR81_15165 [Lentzea tibetensis]